MNELDDLMGKLPEVISGIRAGIRTHGFAVATLGGEAVMHTIGLTEIGHPELVMIGPRPAMMFLEGWAQQVLARERVISPPSMLWTISPDTGQHLVSVAPYTGALGLVAATYGSYTAVLVDPTSCPCELCADKVVVDSDGKYVREAP